VLSAITRVVVCAVVGSAGLSGCASGLSRQTVSVEAVRDAEGVQRVEIGLHSFYFEPNRIVVHAGQPVELVLINRSILVPHNLTLVDSTLSIDRNVWAPGAHRVRFTPRAPGEYEFFCHVDHHAKKGMKGTLVVVP